MTEPGALTTAVRKGATCCSPLSIKRDTWLQIFLWTRITSISRWRYCKYLVFATTTCQACTTLPSSNYIFTKKPDTFSSTVLHCFKNTTAILYPRSSLHVPHVSVSVPSNIKHWDHNTTAFLFLSHTGHEIPSFITERLVDVSRTRPQYVHCRGQWRCRRYSFDETLSKFCSVQYSLFT
jgi:hypothetical protein